MQNTQGDTLVVLLATPDMPEDSSGNPALTCDFVQRLIRRTAVNLGLQVTFIRTAGGEQTVAKYAGGEAHIAVLAGFSRWSDADLAQLIHASTRVNTKLAFSTGGALSRGRAAYMRQIGIPVMRNFREYNSVLTELINSTVLDLCA